MERDSERERSRKTSHVMLFPQALLLPCSSPLQGPHCVQQAVHLQHSHAIGLVYVLSNILRRRSSPLSSA